MNLIEIGQLLKANGLDMSAFRKWILGECDPIIIDSVKNYQRDDVERYIMKNGGEVFEL